MSAQMQGTELYQIPLFQILWEIDLAKYRNWKPAGTGARFGQNLFLDHTTIHEMNLMAMISAAKKSAQFSASFFVTVHQFLTKFV